MLFRSVSQSRYEDDGTTTTHQFAKDSRGHKEALEHKRASVNVRIVEKASAGTGGAMKKAPEPAAVQTGAKKGVAELPPVNKEVADALRNVLGKYAEEGSQVAQLDKASYEQWRTKAVKAMVAGQDSEKNYMLVSMLDRFVHLYNADTGKYGDLS